jgi:hypothetical protein
MSLILKWEMEGLDSEEEAIACAHEIMETGMFRSAGRYGRFVRDCAFAMEAEGLEVPEHFRPFMR